MSTITEAVRAWAKGIYATEAAAELLIRQRRIYEGAPWLVEQDVWGDQSRIVSIDPDTLLYEAGAWSGGEQRTAAIAASLLGGPPVDLSDVLAGNDREHTALVLAAIAHANGSHEASEIEFVDGKPVGFREPGSLYPWPEAHAAAR